MTKSGAQTSATASQKNSGLRWTRLQSIYPPFNTGGAIADDDRCAGEDFLHPGDNRLAEATAFTAIGLTLAAWLLLEVCT